MARNKVIYLVTATSGEYSDRRDWNVKAFNTLKKAEKHCKMAQTTADKMYEKIVQADYWTHGLEISSDYDHMINEYMQETKYAIELVEIG